MDGLEERNQKCIYMAFGSVLENYSLHAESTTSGYVAIRVGPEAVPWTSHAEDVSKLPKLYQGITRCLRSIKHLSVTTREVDKVCDGVE